MDTGRGELQSCGRRGERKQTAGAQGTVMQSWLALGKLRVVISREEK